jgi:peptidyl-prolyl cis-trans isomerase SurA
LQRFGGRGGKRIQAEALNVPAREFMRKALFLLLALVFSPALLPAQQSAPEQKSAPEQPSASAPPSATEQKSVPDQPSAPVQQGQSTVTEEIAARINNAIITRADFRRGREQMLSELRQQAGANADAVFQQRQKDVLRDLIDQQLLLQKAEELGVTADVELVKKLDEIRKSMHANSMEDLEKLAKEQGISFEDFKRNIKNGIITQQVIGHEVGSRIQVTDADIAKYYEEHRTELNRPEQVRLSEILVAPTPGKEKETDPVQVAAAETMANELLKKLRAGESFEETARKFSNGPTAQQGGDLGYFRRGMLAKELEDKTFSLKPGEMTDVVHTRQGFVILKLTEHQQAGLPPLDQMHSQIQEMIYVQRVQPALRTYLTKLREDAYVDVRQGYIDTGASPNAAKPIYITVARPSAADAKGKKKKKQSHNF